MVSTIDKIRDTTIWRTIRKLAGVVDEQNATVENVQNQLDNFNLDGVKSDIASLKTSDTEQNQKLEQLRISDDENTEQNATNAQNISNINSEITTIKQKDVIQDNNITEIRENVEALNKELPTDIVMYKPSDGKIQAKVELEDGTFLDSNVVDMLIPGDFVLTSGTTNRSFKIGYVLTDGTIKTTNDFVIPEGGGTDVSVTSITLAKPTANSIKVSVGLSDGSPIESQTINLVESVSGTFTNNKLVVTVNGVSSAQIPIDTTGTVYTPGTGISIVGGKISVDSTVVAMKSDITDMETKTNANATFATKQSVTDLTTVVNTKASQTDMDTANTNITQLTNAVGDCFNEVSLGADGKSLDFTASDGQVNNVALPTSSKTTINYSDGTTLISAMMHADIGTMLCAQSLLESSSSITGYKSGLYDIMVVKIESGSFGYWVGKGIVYSINDQGGGTATEITGLTVKNASKLNYCDDLNFDFSNYTSITPSSISKAYLIF